MNRDPKPPGETAAVRALLSAPAIGIYLVLLALMLYHRALGFGFNSDAFVLLKNAIDAPLAWDHSYHYMPVTASWLWLQYQFFGLHEAAYEILNVVQHGIIAWLVFLMGLRLDFEKAQALLAALFFVCAGSGYQVALWSVVGSNYFVSGCFYLGGLMLFFTAIRNDQPRLVWFVAGFYLMALLSHEQSLSLAPLCFLYVLLRGDESAGQGPGRLWKINSYLGALRRVWPLLIPLAAFLGLKYAMSLHATVTGSFRGPVFFARNLLKGILCALSFRGNYVSMDHIINLSGKGPLVYLWLIPLGILVFLLMQKGRTVEIFLGLWVLGQLFLMALAIGISIRHLYLPTVASSLLIASLGPRFVATLLRRLPGPFLRRRNLSTASAIIFGLIAIPLFLLPSVSDLSAAQGYWRASDTATKSLELQIRELSGTRPDISSLMILDARKSLSSPGFEIYSFNNGLHQVVSLLTEGRFDSVIIAHSKGSNTANGSQRISPPILDQMMKDPTLGVLQFDSKLLEFRLLSRSSLQETQIEPQHEFAFTSPETRADLHWQAGTFPWLDLHPEEEILGQAFRPDSSGCWIFALTREGQGDRYRLGLEGGERTLVKGQGEKAWRYRSYYLSNLPSERPLRSIIKNTGPGHLNVSRFGFLPERAHYSAGTSPEFRWNSRNAIELPRGTSLTLPLAPCTGPDCRLILTWLALPGHEIEISTSEGLHRKLKATDYAGRKWQTPVLLDGSWSRGSIELKAVGKEASEIRQLRGMLMQDNQAL